MFELFSIALHLFSSLHPGPVGSVGGNGGLTAGGNGGVAGNGGTSDTATGGSADGGAAVGGVGGNDATSGDANGGTATGAKAGLEVTLPAAQADLLQAEQVELVAVLLAVPTEQ